MPERETGAPPDTEFVHALLQLPSQEAQLAYLQTAGRLTPDGLGQLLDVAMNLARSDPGLARRLTTVCQAAAELTNETGFVAPGIIPRALYIRAQTHALKGELTTALDLIQAARDGYDALGESLSALRTNVGLMHVLNELGRHQEAIQTGHTVLTRLSAAPTEMADDDRLITALVHHNLGVCYRLMGRYEEALTAYDMAQSAYTAVGLTERLGDIYNNRGLILLHLGRVSEALAAFERGARVLQEAGHTLLYAQALINIGEAHLLLGHYTRSLEALAQAGELLQTRDALAEAYVLRLQQADVYLALNLYPEALAAYREADQQCQAAGMTHYRARALWGVGTALTALAQHEEAEQALVTAADLFQAAGNIPLLSGVMLEQAALTAARGEPDAALTLAQRALDLVAGQEWPVQQLYAHLRLADWRMPDTAAAEAHLLQAQQLSDQLDLPYLRYRLLQRLGHVRQRQGRYEEAEFWLASAVEEIERLRGAVAQEAMRISFVHDKTAAYDNLLQLYLDHGDRVAAAFAVAERARSRALVDLLTGVAAPLPALPNDPILAGRLQVLQADLNAIYNTFLDHKPEQEAAGETGTVAWTALRARARAIEDEINRLRLETASMTMHEDPLTAAWSLDAIQARLPPEQPLIAYYTLGEEIIAFVSQAGAVQVVRRLSSLSAVQEMLRRLAVQWERFRAGADFVQRHMARLEQSTQRILADLHAALFAPLRPLLTAAPGDKPTPLAIVPHGLLHHVPFHALFDGERYVLEQFEVAYAPSATVLALAQLRQRSTSTDALVMGVPDAFITAVTAEAQAVARQLTKPGWSAARLCLGEAATLAAFQAYAPGAGVLHLACHGLFRADNPLFSALKLHDGWLKAADVVSLDLAGALVTLSACESGRSQALAGDEVTGLTRAFLAVGAATVVVSLWLAPDETTVELMQAWYQQRQSEPDQSWTAALRKAQLALKIRYPHPYYWAPFILVGRR